MDTIHILVILMFVRRAFAGSATIITKSAINWGLRYDLDIVGHWSVNVRIRGCQNMQIGLFGPTQSTTNGYFIDLYRLSGENYISAIRKICPECSGTIETNFDNGLPSSDCDTTYYDYWFSWDECTIRMGRGTTVKQDELVSWQDMNISEIRFIGFGSSDGTTYGYFNFNTMIGNNSVNINQDCANLPCPAQSRPSMSTNAPAFVFHLSGEDQSFNNPDDIIFTATGLTRRECNNQCLCNAQCIQFSVSTTGGCMLSNRCSPELKSDKGHNVYNLTYWGKTSK